MSASGRARLPTCVVRIRSVLRFIAPPHITFGRSRPSHRGSSRTGLAISRLPFHALNWSSVTAWSVGSDAGTTVMNSSISAPVASRRRS